MLDYAGVEYGCGNRCDKSVLSEGGLVGFV